MLNANDFLTGSINGRPRDAPGDMRPGHKTKVPIRSADRNLATIVPPIPGEL
jgi:hypothetical protein